MKTLVIIRGVPGSGKSTLAKIIAGSCSIGGATHFESDQYFMQDGEYKFDPTKLGENHARCQDDVDKAMQMGIGTIVVSNTFTTKKEVAPYLDLAKIHDYKTQVITSQADFGNVHNVPEEVVKKMRARWVWDVLDS